MQAAHMAMQPALQQQRADLEVRNWMFQQDFNRQDQQELARQQAAASELQDKLDKGEISQKEFYRMFGDVAPRVNYLQAKEQHTRVRALETQRKSQAEENAARTKLLNAQYAGISGSAESRYVFDPDERYRGQAEDQVDILYPDLKAINPAQREQEIRDLMKRNGWGKKGTVQPKGEIQWDKPEKGEGTGAAGGPKAASEHQSFEARQKMFHDAYATAQKLLTVKDETTGLTKTPSADEVKAKAEELMRDNLKFHEQHGGVEKLSPDQLKQASDDEAQKMRGALAARQDLSPVRQAQAAGLLAQAKEIYDKFYTTGKPVPTEIQKHYTELKRQYDQITSTR